MLDRIETTIRRLRYQFSRTGLLIRLFGLGRKTKEGSERGLVLIQLDALSRRQLEDALISGKVPFLKHLQDRQYYQLMSHYSGMPCSTAAVQAELFYGVKSAVPAFSFYDPETERVFTMFNPPDASAVEERLKKRGTPLLAGGSGYSNIYTGGAEEPHFCISDLILKNFFKLRQIFSFLVLTLLHLYSLIRTAVLLVLECCLAVKDCCTGIIRGRDLWKELKFVPSRVGMCVLLRELIVIGAKIDTARGMPIIQLNLMGYHEQSHRRGATSRFAQWTLRGMDDAIKRIWVAAHRSAARDYDVWLYSDHGQINTVPYEQAFGASISETVNRLFDRSEGVSTGTPSKQVGFRARLGLRTSRFFESIFGTETRSDRPIVTALGPMGLIYLKRPVEAKEKEELAKRLVCEGHIPMVFYVNSRGTEASVEVWTEEGHFQLPRDADRIFDTESAFYDEMVNDFVAGCQYPAWGDFIICGQTLNRSRCYSFAIENGSHGGVSAEEAEGFVLMPRHRVREKWTKGYIRPLDLRDAVLTFMGQQPEVKPALNNFPATPQNMLRVMTYNVHGCMGIDGKLSARRIAEVIAQYQPDIVALQELDVQRLRSGKEDQALKIAGYLNMDFHFHPSLCIAEEMFGDAILSTLPMKLIKKDCLSRERRFFNLEPRGAVWVEIKFLSRSVHIFNTHLGLHPAERLLHAAELLGPDWLGASFSERPTIFCGDFNCFAGSKVFRLLGEHLHSVQSVTGNGLHKNTWFGRYPMVCIDHIFVSPDIQVLHTLIGDSYLARLASDHRPIITDLIIP